MYCSYLFIYKFIDMNIFTAALCLFETVCCILHAHFERLKFIILSSKINLYLLCLKYFSLISSSSIYINILYM